MRTPIGPSRAVARATARAPFIASALAIAIASVATPRTLRAQASTSPAATDTTPPPAAAPADVSSLDAILRALYDVISGPAGQPRNWQRFRSLFIPGARLIPTRFDSTTGRPRTIVLTPDEYATRAAGRLQQQAFYENEIGRTVDTFGAVTQVFSAYASRREPGGQPFARGINSIQLFNDGNRWYVVTIFWQAERPGLTVPGKYLTNH